MAPESKIAELKKSIEVKIEQVRVAYYEKNKTGIGWADIADYVQSLNKSKEYDRKKIRGYSKANLNRKLKKETYLKISDEHSLEDYASWLDKLIEILNTIPNGWDKTYEYRNPPVQEYDSKTKKLFNTVWEAYYYEEFALEDRKGIIKGLLKIGENAKIKLEVTNGSSYHGVFKIFDKRFIQFELKTETQEQLFQIIGSLGPISDKPQELIVAAYTRIASDLRMFAGLMLFKQTESSQDQKPYFFNEKNKTEWEINEIIKEFFYYKDTPHKIQNIGVYSLSQLKKYIIF